MKVKIDRELLLGILENAKTLHPKETILLLRGKVKKGEIMIKELVIPPLATYGHGFTTFPLAMLPMDFSIIGTLHSHPSGSLNPSTADLNHFFGKILMIVAWPYEPHMVAAYNRKGEKLDVEIIS